MDFRFSQTKKLSPTKRKQLPLQTHTMRKCNIIVITQTKKKKAIPSFCQSTIATQPLSYCLITGKSNTRLLNVTQCPFKKNPRIPSGLRSTRVTLLIRAAGF